MHTSTSSSAALTSLLALALASPILAAEPPNGPSAARWTEADGALTLEYHGTTILRVSVTAKDAKGGDVAVRFENKTTGANGKTEQALSFAPADGKDGATLVLSGLVTGTDEAFPAETASEAQKRFPCVRNSAGQSRNLRNNAVYDRRHDWVLIGPPDGATRITPQTSGATERTFGLESRGERIELLFRPRFYQQFHDLKYYEPWSYKVWRGSPTGYCTWWSYRGNFTQETLAAMLGLFVEKHLPDFGYGYMQFDNCYQVGNGSCPENWLNWDRRKYPGGWRHAIKAIRAAGMKPGIWVHRIHRPGDPHVKEIVAAHPDWFVRKPDGALVTHRGFHVLDTTNEEAVDHMVRKLYRGLREQGWDYVKIDGTGDLLRAYQDKQCEDFFSRRPTTPEESLRMWDTVARRELGPDVYILACHTVGNARQVIGLVDGGRLSNDGFQPRTLAQYNHLEGVVWRNDPDHCDVLGEWLMDLDAMMPVFGSEAPVPARSIIRPAICTMAGGVLMLSDKLEVYQDDRNIEGIKRSSPVLFTVPGQLYGLGRRAVPWWLQEIDRPFDHWSVLARIQWGEKEKDRHVYHFQGMPEQEIRFADLGLPEDREHLVCEFWSQQYLGKFKGSFTAPAMDRNDGMDVFAIHEARPHPWVISTSRHISQGGVSLLGESWNADTLVLSGRSKVVIDDPYILTIHLPAGYRLKNAEVDGGTAEIENHAETAAVRILPPATRTMDWTLEFERQTGETR